MMRKKSDDAVSPVIGVMLLLVVTIVVAAVVAVFASGVGTGAEPAPTTVLDVTEIRDGGYSTGVTDTESTELIKYFFDQPTFKNDVLMEGVGTDYDKYMERSNAWDNGEELSYRGYSVRWDAGNLVLYINGRLMTNDESYVLDEVVDTPEFAVLDGYYSEESAGSTPGTAYYPVTVTITSSAGDILNMQKVSIKVYKNSVLVAEKDSLSGSLAPGDKQTIRLNEIMNEEEGNFNPVNKYDKVEVFVLYGEHILVSEEMKVRG